MADGDQVRPKIVHLVKDHFRLRREPGQTLSPKEWQQHTNGFLYAMQHTLAAVGDQSELVRFAADLRLLINQDKVDEANAKVDAL